MLYTGLCYRTWTFSSISNNDVWQTPPGQVQYVAWEPDDADSTVAVIIVNGTLDFGSGASLTGRVHTWSTT